MSSDDSTNASVGDQVFDEEHGDGQDFGVSERSEGSIDSDLTRYLVDGNLDDVELDKLEDELASFDDLPDEMKVQKRKDFLVKFHREVVRIEATNGPLPPPSMLAGYEEVLSGAADRIVLMAESQQTHRHAIERMVISSNIANERLGTIVGGLLAVLGILGSFALLFLGKSIEGFAAVLLELVSLAAVFINSQHTGKDELEAKRKQSDGNSIQG